MVDGLKLTLSGHELRTLLEARIGYHNRSAERWRREQLRTREDESEDAPLLPEHICQHEEERHVWRAGVLGFVRDHIEAQETYRLGAADLKFGEFLPPKPESVEQDEYEERHAVPFQLARLTKRMGELASRGSCRATEAPEPFPGYSVTRVEIEDGPEIIRIDRT